MPRDHRLYLDDILEPIDNIHDYTANMNYETFMLDRKTRDAVIRNLEIIGEAAGRIPEEVRSAAQEIEWRKIVGLRNILAMSTSPSASQSSGTWYKTNSSH